MLPSIVQNSIWKHFIQPCVNEKCFFLCPQLLSIQDALSLKDSGSGLPQCSIGGRYCSVMVSMYNMGSWSHFGIVSRIL